MPSKPITGFGYYGKVPVRGDFIQEHLTAEFVAPWSEWLQAVLAVSREQHDNQWLDIYLTSPIWHFALSAGVCGDSAMIGTLMPSVDQVGRHFYFTIAKPVTGSPLSYWNQRDWSLAAEEKILRTLDDDVDVVKWADSLAQAKWLAKFNPEKPVVNQAQQSPQHVYVNDPAVSTEQLLHAQLRTHQDRYCMWWTSGSERLSETTLVTEGLPLVSQFSAMLDGEWEKWGW